MERSGFNSGYIYTSNMGSDLNWSCFEKDPDVGRISYLNWVGSAISVYMQGLSVPEADRIKFLSDPPLLVQT